MRHKLHLPVLGHALRASGVMACSSFGRLRCDTSIYSRAARYSRSSKLCPTSLLSHLESRIVEKAGNWPPACADGPQVLLPRALRSVTIPATTFPRLQAAVRQNRLWTTPDYDGAGRVLQAKGCAPDPGPRSSSDQIRYIACLPAQTLRPSHSP